MPIETIIASVSTLFGVGITLYFTNKREKQRFKQEFTLSELKEIEGTYISMLASIDKAIFLTKRGDDYKDFYVENAGTSAKVSLIGSDEINQQFNRVSNILYTWSSFYRLGLPKKVGDTGYAVASNMQNKHSEKAVEIFPKVEEEVAQLIKLVQEELSSQKKKLKK